MKAQNRLCSVCVFLFQLSLPRVSYLTVLSVVSYAVRLFFFLVTSIVLSLQRSTTALPVQPPEPTKLSPLDEEKVSHIVEVCAVTRDEALRVLETCMMDETMAIERILSGNGLNSWSQVSKKKKPPQSRSTNRAPHHNTDRDRNQGRRDRRDRDRSGPLPASSDQPNSQSNGYRRPGGSTRQFQNQPQSNRNKSQLSAASSGRMRALHVQSSGHLQGTASNYGQQPSASNAVPGNAQSVSSWPASNLPKPSETTQTWGSPPREGRRDGQDLGAPRWESQEPQMWGDAPTASLNETSEEPWTESLHSPSPPQPQVWTSKDPLERKDRNADSTSKTDMKNMSDTSQTIDPSQKPPIKSPQKSSQVSTVKRTFNYAAAAAAGTSHEKPVQPSSPERNTTSVQQDTPEEDASIKEKVDDSANIDPIVSNQNTSAVSSPADRTVSTSERTADAGNNTNSSAPVVPSVPNLSPAPSKSPAVKGVSPIPVAQHSNTDTLTSPLPTKQENLLETPNRTTAWSSRPISENKEEKQLEEAVAAAAVASAAVVGNEATGEDALSLQFGSFGLGGLDVSWTPPLPKISEPVGGSVLSTSQSNVSTVANSSGSTPNVSSAPAAIASPQGNNLPVVAPVTSVMPNNSVAPPAPPMVPAPAPVAPSSMNVGSSFVSGTSSARAHDNGAMLSNQSDPRVNALSSSALHLPNVSSTGSGSGMFPVLAMPGPGASFGPANYGAPYLVPPLHGYSPALVSYGDNANDLNSSRGPSLGPPGSLPLYDPNLPVMGSGSGKYGAIPGLGDMTALGAMQSGVSKEGHQSNPEMEKGNGLSTSGLGNGMDPLAAPYMLPGYPSVQYPMYTFPSPPYGPPGMAPPGANPFPYAAAGQVTSQGGRGFGFDDGVGLGANSRNGAGLGESMYTPGAYLTNGNPKGGPDGSYKSGRGNNGGGLSGMGMGGGMMVGMGYGDYTGVMGGVGNNVGGGGGSGGAGWGHRHANGMRDGNGNSGMMSNGAMGSNVAPGAGGGYGSGAGSAAGGNVAGGNAGGSGYWPGQASGYYS